MKRSRQVTLLFSGALATALGACSGHRDPPPPPPGSTTVYGQHRDDVDQQNNSYVPNYGYYHSYYHNWYDYPFDWFVPGRGYYYGGWWHPNPFGRAAPLFSRPIFSRYRGGGYRSLFGGGGTGFFGGSSSDGGSFAGSSSSVSRGGFGSTAHGGAGT